MSHVLHVYLRIDVTFLDLPAYEHTNRSDGCCEFAGNVKLISIFFSLAANAAYTAQLQFKYFLQKIAPVILSPLYL